MERILRMVQKEKIYAREKSEDGKPISIHQINSKEDVTTLERKWKAKENKTKHAIQGVQKEYCR